MVTFYVQIYFKDKKLQKKKFWLRDFDTAIDKDNKKNSKNNLYLRIHFLDLTCSLNKKIIRNLKKTNFYFWKSIIKSTRKYNYNIIKMILFIYVAVNSNMS